LSLLPPGIQIDLLTAVALAPFLLIFSPFIGAVVFAALVSTLAFGLMHPQQLLQLLMMLGL
jgi:hypothetical protein